MTDDDTNENETDGEQDSDQQFGTTIDARDPDADQVIGVDVARGGDQDQPGDDDDATQDGDDE